MNLKKLLWKYSYCRFSLCTPNKTSDHLFDSQEPTAVTLDVFVQKWLDGFLLPNIVMGSSQSFPWRWKTSFETWTSSPLFICPVTFGTFLYNGKAVSCSCKYLLGLIFILMCFGKNSLLLEFLCLVDLKARISTFPGYINLEAFTLPFRLSAFEHLPFCYLSSIFFGQTR